jgi:hypothetical protein
MNVQNKTAKKVVVRDRLSLFGGGLNVLHFEVITDRQSILSASIYADTFSLLFEL